MEDNELYDFVVESKVNSNGEVLDSRTKKKPDYLWMSPGINPKNGAAVIYGNGIFIRFHPRVDRVENYVENRREAERLTLMFVNMLGPGNILYSLNPKGIPQYKKYASDKDIADYLQISEKKAREFMRKFINSGLLREISGKSKITGEKIWIYTVNPNVVTYRNRISVITYYAWKDILEDKTTPAIVRMFEGSLFIICKSFSPLDEKDALIKDFLLSKIKRSKT